MQRKSWVTREEPIHGCDRICSPGIAYWSGARGGGDIHRRVRLLQHEPVLGCPADDLDHLDEHHERGHERGAGW
jgi:hypothetical protein